MELTALTGPQGAELTVEIAAVTGAKPVDTLPKVQVKVFGGDDAVEDVRNVNDVPAPGGVATIALGQLPRDRLLEVLVHVKPSRTYVLRGETRTRLRPDLVVASIAAPQQTLTTRPVDIRAEIAELNGDTGGQATVTLSWGPSPLASRTVDVQPGASAPVAFTGVELGNAVPVELTIRVHDVAPAETDAENNAETATVDVTAHELVPSWLVLPSLGGYGVQFNQHVYAAITNPPPGSLPDLEAKAKALEPQLVRIFFNEVQERTPDRMASFVETVRLAHEAGATINITYQTATNAKNQPEAFMTQFAAVLDDLVRTRGFASVRWVTIQNEPNDTAVTLAQYEALYRALDAQLVARGLGEQIGLMGGDLVEAGDNPNQPNKRDDDWFAHMAEHMSDVLDAYSVHIYWNYWDIARMEFRLRDVRRLVDGLGPAAQKPLYVTEFGVRGILNFPGKPSYQPGYWQDGTPLARTNIAAFQQLWFDLVSAQLGYAGAVKWDAYWGRYDTSYNASHYLIGPAEEGWPLFPAYHAFRLLFQTTQRGWQVLRVAPWTEDDWSAATLDQPEQELAAYAGPDGLLTLVGLDTHGRGLNGASVDGSAYSIGGLPSYTAFTLAVWNAAATGENAIAGEVTTNAAGVARFEVPLHAAFALTTAPAA
jgi:hypothetical protein